MNEKIVKSQAELDAVPVDFNGRIYIEFGTPYNCAVVNRRFKYSVVAWENSSVVAWDNSSVEASSNTQVVDRTWDHKIKASGNARVVYDPKTVEQYAKTYGLEIADGKIKLYKAVHRGGKGEYFSDRNRDFQYEIGKTAKADSLTGDPAVDCGHGIHMAHKAWCVSYGRGWSDLAILELEADASGVVVPLYGVGKVRALKATVLREVPLEECGLLGKMLAKRRESK